MSKIHKYATVEIELGAPVELLRMEATEAFSELFEINAIVLTELPVDLTPALGKPGTFYMQDFSGASRTFNGILTGGRFIELVAGAEKAFKYQITLRPQLYLHAHNKNFRIFQDKSVPDVIKSVLDSCKVKYRINLQETYTPRGYCVQFGESDYDFISRLMEEEGIYFYFDHAEHEHTLVIVDAIASHAMSEAPTFKYNPDSGQLTKQQRSTNTAENYMYNWSETVSTEGQKNVQLRDHIFAAPAQKYDKNTATVTQATIAQTAEVYDFKSTYEYEQPAGGGEAPDVLSKHLDHTDRLAAKAMESLESGRQVFRGVSVSLHLLCGQKFTITEHPMYDEQNEYVPIRSRTVAVGENFYASDSLTDDTGSEIEAVIAKRNWRPKQRANRRPVAHGLQTAIVTGPGGQEIFVDKYGRVKVQFFWDREGKTDANSSCWLRVSQTGGLGNVILPRVGHEVLVAFMDGNPDRPIIVGRVFSEAKNNMPIYSLPDHHTIATWRTKSFDTKANGLTKTDQKTLSTGAHKLPKYSDQPVEHKKTLSDDQMGNELLFEDTKEAEEVFLYAQLDMRTAIRADEMKLVGRNQYSWIGWDSTRIVENNSTTKILKDNTVEVTKNEVYDIKGTNKLTVTEANEETYKDSSKITVTKTLTVDGQSDILIKAATKITLECAGSKIELSAQGIKMSGMTFSAEGQTTAAMKGGVSAEVSAQASATLKASGMTQVTGAMVKIN